RPPVAAAGRRRRAPADARRLPAHDLDAWGAALPRHERRPVRVRLLHLRPAAEDTEPGWRLERQAEHGVRETLHLAALGVAHGGEEDAFVRLVLRRRGATADPVAYTIGTPERGGLAVAV